MKQVAKYNTLKGVSTLLTIGTPIVTLLNCGDFFVQSDRASMSAAGMFVMLLVAVFCKDKILENFKTPPVFVICLLMFLFIALIESIMIPIKTVCITTMVATGIDEFTFKQAYKNIEFNLPKNAEAYKKFGFLTTTTKTLIGGDK